VFRILDGNVIGLLVMSFVRMVRNKGRYGLVMPADSQHGHGARSFVTQMRHSENTTLECDRLAFSCWAQILFLGQLEGSECDCYALSLLWVGA
jgi:hypothetical protein